MRIDVEMCLKMVLFVSEITPKILHLLDEFHQMFRLSLFKISKIKKMILLRNDAFKFDLD